jgi:hypothetical protein
MPLFSTALIAVLRSGVKGGYPYGLSFQSLQLIIDQKIDRATLSSGVKRHHNNADLSDWRFMLSNVITFPNNDLDRSHINDIARRTRAAYMAASRDRTKRELVEGQHNAAQHELKALQTAYEESQARLSAVNAEVVKISQMHNEEKGKAAAELRTSSRLIKLIAFVVFVSFAALASVFYQPELLCLTKSWTGGRLGYACEQGPNEPTIR